MQPFIFEHCIITIAVYVQSLGERCGILVCISGNLLVRTRDVIVCVFVCACVCVFVCV